MVLIMHLGHLMYSYIYRQPLMSMRIGTPESSTPSFDLNYMYMYWACLVGDWMYETPPKFPRNRSHLYTESCSY